MVDCRRRPRKEIKLPICRPRWLATVGLLSFISGACGSREVPIIGDEDVCKPPVEADLIDVIDGDTIDVLADGSSQVERVRLLGVQAGEIYYSDDDQACTSQDDGECCYGDRALDWLADLLDRVDVVTLGFDSECTDIYDRTLGYIWIQDPHEPDETEPWFVNEQLLSQGIARYFDEVIGNAQNIRFKTDFEAAEAKAALEGLGLWEVCE